MTDINGLEPVATFCGNCDCGCPQLFVDANARAEQRIVLTDDFGLPDERRPVLLTDRRHQERQAGRYRPALSRRRAVKQLQPSHGGVGEQL
jgi:hypothetical protein